MPSPWDLVCSGERPNIHRAPNQTISNMPTPIKSIRDDGKLVTSFSHHYTPHKIHHVEGNARGVATARYGSCHPRRRGSLSIVPRSHDGRISKKSLAKKDCNKNVRVIKMLGWVSVASHKHWTMANLVCKSVAPTIPYSLPYNRSQSDDVDCNVSLHIFAFFSSFHLLLHVATGRWQNCDACSY